MYKLLVKLVLLAALWELGASAWEMHSCASGECVRKVEKASKKVLDVEWKPISVFPEVGRGFKERKRCR